MTLSFQDYGATLPEELPIQRHTLPNGIQLLLCPQPQFHRTCVMLTVNAGSRDEQKTGVAHLLEHLIFRGTKNYPSLRELSTAFENIGTDFNAYTSREVTSFDLVMPPASLEKSLKLLAEAIITPKLTGIDGEREIIREEILSDYDENNNLTNGEDILHQSLFKGSFAEPIAGSPKDVEILTKNDVLEFYQSFYRPSNIYIVITGNIMNVSHTVELVKDAFGAMPAAPVPERDGKAQPAESHALFKVKAFKSETQSDVLFGFLCPGVHDPQFPALEILVRALDDGMSSRLSRRLIDELALVYDAEAYITTARELSLFQMRVSCRHRRVQRVVMAFFEILSELIKNPPKDEELNRIKRRILWEHASLLDSITSLAQWLTSMATQNLDLNPGKRCESLLKITPEEIVRFVEDILLNAQQRLVIVGNISRKTATRLVEEIQEKHGVTFELTYEE